MEIKIDVFHHFVPQEATPPPWAEALMSAIQEMNVSLQEKLDLALTEAQETATVADSIITLLNGIKAQLDGVLNGEGTLNQVIDSLNETQSRIVAAITANTPAAEEPAPE